MDKDREKTPRSQRALALASVWLLSAAAAVSFGRLFSVPHATSRLLLAATAAVALAALTERRHLVLAGAVSVVGLVAGLGLLVFRETLWHGVPSSATLSAIAKSVGFISAQARTQVAPTPALAPLMLAAISAAWASSFASHSLAVRAGSPLLASLPPLAMFTFADVVLAEGSRPGYSILMLVGILAVVFADGLRRVRQWGPIETWRSSVSSRRSRLATGTRGAPSLAVLVVGIAILAPGLLPGWGSEGAFDAAGGRGTSLDPMVSLRADLASDPDRPLFEVTASTPAYWRLLSLDHFDGVGWSASDAPAGRDLGPDGIISAIPGQEALRQEFRIQGLTSPWLPMAYNPAAVSLPEGHVAYVDDAAVARTSVPVPPDTAYRVDSTLVAPTPAELDAASDPSSSAIHAALPEGFYERYTQLPEDTPSIVRETAVKVSADAPDEYRKMLAIQYYLRNRFSYTEDVRVPRGTDPMLWFLTESRAGFCQQFAGAMTAMARSLGYPARVAVGFLPGKPWGVDHWQVTTADAHAWPEIYFGELGWVAFEPTPGRVNPVASAYLVDPRYLRPVKDAAGIPGQKSAAANPSAPRDTFRRKGGLDSLSSPPSARSPLSYWWTALLALMSLGLLALLSVPFVKAIRRRHIVRSAREPRDLVLAGYRVFEEKAADAGFARAAGQTLVEYGDGLRQHVAFSEGHFDRLVTAAIRAAYSATETAAEEASQAIDDERAATQDVLASVPMGRKILGRFRLRERTRFRS